MRMYLEVVFYYYPSQKSYWTLLKLKGQNVIPINKVNNKNN